MLSFVQVYMMSEANLILTRTVLIASKGITPPLLQSNPAFCGRHHSAAHLVPPAAAAAAAAATPRPAGMLRRPRAANQALPSSFTQATQATWLAALAFLIGESHTRAHARAHTHTL